MSRKRNMRERVKRAAPSSKSKVRPRNIRRTVRTSPADFPGQSLHLMDRVAGKRTGITRTKRRDRMQPVKKTLALQEDLKIEDGSVFICRDFLEMSPFGLNRNVP